MCTSTYLDAPAGLPVPTSVARSSTARSTCARDGGDGGEFLFSSSSCSSSAARFCAITSARETPSASLASSCPCDTSVPTSARLPRKVERKRMPSSSANATTRSPPPRSSGGKAGGGGGGGGGRPEDEEIRLTTTSGPPRRLSDHAEPSARKEDEEEDEETAAPAAAAARASSASAFAAATATSTPIVPSYLPPLTTVS